MDGRGRKFSAKTGHISETVRDKAKVTIIATGNRKWHTSFQIT